MNSKKTAHEVWEELETIHVGSKKLREEKYQVLKGKLNNTVSEEKYQVLKGP